MPKSMDKAKYNQEIASSLRTPRINEKFAERKKDVSYDEFISNKMLIIAAIRAGVPYSLFSFIQQQAPFSEEDWAYFLDISTKSLHRYKTSDNFYFKAIHSEKIIEMAEVTQVGMDVLGSLSKLKLWLQTPNFALGKLKPLELLKDSYGKELVVSELTRIDHGILV